MITQQLILKKYNWGITLLIKESCEDVSEVMEWLQSIQCPSKLQREAYSNLSSCNKNIGLTYSNYQMSRTIMVISTTTDKNEETNTITHECYHFICHLQKARHINNEEELATLTGILNMNIFELIGR